MVKFIFENDHLNINNENLKMYTTGDLFYNFINGVFWLIHCEQLYLCSQLCWQNDLLTMCYY